MVIICRGALTILCCYSVSIGAKSYGVASAERRTDFGHRRRPTHKCLKGSILYTYTPLKGGHCISFHPSSRQPSYNAREELVSPPPPP